jgi:hypothetical protein
MICFTELMTVRLKDKTNETYGWMLINEGREGNAKRPSCSRSQWPFACWDCGFESRRGHGYLSVVTVVCCQVEVSATGWSLVQRSSTECGVSECDCEVSIMRRPWPTRGLLQHGQKETLVGCVMCLSSRTPKKLRKPLKDLQIYGQLFNPKSPNANLAVESCRTVPFICTPSTASLPHSKPASTGVCSDICRDGETIRNTQHIN